MKFTSNLFASLRLAKTGEGYEVFDVPIDNLTFSVTRLHSKTHTKGHSHNETDELYIVLSGRGTILLDENEDKLYPGDFIVIPRGVFHRSYNNGKDDLIFACIFAKYKGRGK